MAPESRRELLIASVTPQNLERGDLWFAENAAAIKKSLLTHPWWQNNAITIEKDLTMKPSFFARRLTELGYERAATIHGKGLFAARGGIMEVWPINTGHPWLVEFDGNRIGEIAARDKTAEEILPRLRPDAERIEKLAPGAYVVHADHGIGIYRGIQNSPSPAEKNVNQQISYDRIKNVDERSSDFYRIEYAAPWPGREPDTLLVPHDAKDRLTPYVGFDTPHIHRLGGALWLKTRRRIKEGAEKLARELLSLYEVRARVQRPPYERDFTLEKELRASFPYQETPDQISAEQDIMRDLERIRPMDRILCGDVGFGKTEIAVRAALAAIASGRQVAVLSPTTILAAQHAKTFSERLRALPISVRMLSRLTPPEEQRRIVAHIREGRTDCIIGTHRILSKDIAFKNLGLVIIDEEQRFGVKQKERFKELRAEADILSLSATPIPRTMQFAMAKLKDISVISTPPPERLPIKTILLPHNTRIIRNAISAELARGGQVYFLHNRIETIGAVREKLQKILKQKSPSPPFSYGRHKKAARRDGTPRIGVIHGRMNERELIKAMDQFRAQEINILLATAIIENGLDISSANTLIVDDAARLGLAQAHQLRGRIGRGAAQAFAYFLYKPRHLTAKAGERLAALQEYAALGVGYEIALRDLEIRGAGNIIGREQSGAINKIGLNLYCQILTDAVEDLRTHE